MLPNNENMTLNAFERILMNDVDFNEMIKTLTRLTLKDVTVRNDCTEILQKSCGNLNLLQFYSCVINNYTQIPQLEKICFVNCRGLTFNIFRTILTQRNLKYFKALNTRFGCDYYYRNFYITRLIEHFEVNCDDEMCRQLLVYNCRPKNRLKNLKKCLLPTYEYGVTLLKTHFGPNLEDLRVDLLYITVDYILQLVHLQRLVLNLFYADEMWKLLRLLQIPNLRDLSIINYEVVDDYNVIDIDNFRSNLLHFIIPGTMMDSEQNFLLYMLNVNTDLTLQCNDICNSRIREVLLHKEFPVRFVNICDRIFDCQELRENIAEIEEHCNENLHNIILN